MKREYVHPRSSDSIVCFDDAHAGGKLRRRKIAFPEY